MSSGNGKLLVVDVGNTQTHFGVFDHGSDTVAEQWRFATVRESTADEIGSLLAGLLALRGIGFADISGSIVSSTVPQLSEQWAAMAERYLQGEVLTVGPALKTGMPIRTENPHEVGADRLVNAVAAYARVRSTCVVVDFGTAVIRRRVGQGGIWAASSPGHRDPRSTRCRNRAKLPRVELTEPREVIGRSTVEKTIRSGIAFGFGGQVEESSGGCGEELGASTR